MWKGRDAAHLWSCHGAAAPLGFIPGKLYSPLLQSVIVRMGKCLKKDFTSLGLCGFELCLLEMAESHHRSLELFFFFFFVVEK